MNFHLNAVTNLVLRLGPVAQRWELSLARAVFLHRLGEIRDRKPENQSYRASGLTLLTATDALLGVSLDIENYCTLRLFFDLSTLAGLNRRNLPEAGILLLFQI